MATAFAVAMAAATLGSALLSGSGGLTVILGLALLASVLGSAFYVGLQRTASATSVTANGERVLAHGVGRGGRGFLGGHAVAVTEGSILSISARPWGVGRVAAVIRLREIESVGAVMDFLEVGDGRTTITLKGCPPSQVTALLDRLR
ncbi:MAG TPA: hypothetical protein VD741_04555 [Solirubrobacterales bacterium]|nr:hypothetical protein [Solirubrobacterales bacterium]